MVNPRQYAGGSTVALQSAICDRSLPTSRAAARRTTGLMMPDPESNDSNSPPSRGQTPALTLILLLAATVGAYNFSSRPGEAPSSPAGTQKAEETSGAVSGPPPRADVADALQTLEPLLRFLDLETIPGSLEELAARLGDYHVTTLIASLSDPTDSRLGYDFDMATEAIQRAIESEGYTLDRFRFPWLNTGSTGNSTQQAPANSGAGTAPSTPRPAPGGNTVPLSLQSALRGSSHERQPGTILFRIDRAALERTKRPLPRNSCCFFWSGKRRPGESSRRRS